MTVGGIEKITTKLLLLMLVIQSNPTKLQMKILHGTKQRICYCWMPNIRVTMFSLGDNKDKDKFLPMAGESMIKIEVNLTGFSILKV